MQLLLFKFLRAAYRMLGACRRPFQGRPCAPSGHRPRQGLPHPDRHSQASSRHRTWLRCTAVGEARGREEVGGKQLVQEACPVPEEEAAQRLRAVQGYEAQEAGGFLFLSVTREVIWLEEYLIDKYIGPL